jgi:purine-cytosine permease-like protein
MYQIYFLSILTLLLSGITLSFERDRGSARVGSLFNAEVLNRPTFRMVLGLGTFLAGFLRILTVTPGDVPFIGDIVPAITGLLLGAVLIVDYYRSRSTVESAFVDTVHRIFVRNGSRYGVIGIVVAVLHFLFHRGLLL